MSETIVPLTPDRWDDFVALCRQMGPNRSCWCMYWRDAPGTKRPQTKRDAARHLVDDGPPPGLIAYHDEVPVGWVAVAPRPEYRRLNEGRDTAPVDDTPDVWAVPCFFVVEEARGSGVQAALLNEAVKFAFAHGARHVEGVPGDPATRTRTSSASYTGTLPTFIEAGFSEIARRTAKGRVVVRRTTS
jgi:GNAT superfamily N-acetyltransferase